MAEASASIFGGNVSVYVTDMDRAIEFYTKKLGLILRTRMKDNSWAEIEAGLGLIIGLHPANPPTTVPAGTVGAINIELAVTKPLEEVQTELATRGVGFRTPIATYPAVRLASIRDPDDNTILLSQALKS